MIQFYQSPSDKARFDVLLRVLSEETPNLAIIGDDEMALAHYGRAIHQRLSQLPHAQVDLWGAVDSEQLVSRFNEILSELTLEQAQDKAQKTPTRRCFIITDAQAVQTLELQLLARLIQGFPASHVHTVLLVNRNESYQKKLEVFGKALLRWELESEHPQPARMQRIETRDAEPAVAPSPVASTASVLQARQAVRAAPAAAASSPVTADASERAPQPGSDPWSQPASATMPELDVPVPADLGPAPESTAAVAAPAPSSRLGWGLLLALLVTLTVLGVLNRQLIVDQWVALQNYVSGQRPARPGAETAPDAAAAPRVGMSSTNQLPVKPDDSLIPDKESLVSARPAAESGTDAAAPVAAAPAPTSAPPAATPVPASALPAKTVTPTPSPAASNKNATAEREALLVDSRQWVRELPANGWVLQHAAREMLEDAKAEKAGSSALKDARILLAPRKSKGYYYIVVTGPYPNRATAQDLMKSTPGWSKAWLRGPKSMQQQFED